MPVGESFPVKTIELFVAAMQYFFLGIKFLRFFRRPLLTQGKFQRVVNCITLN